jgi:predicted acylesterase/phospholipase RssA
LVADEVIVTTETSTTRAPTVDDFLPTPTRWCDLIMKGGVTSGVVYPRAVSTLARTYRFKNIGGTSAGAIAASAAAAAEHGRQHRRGKHFQEIDALPDFLKERNRVFRLFQPQRKTRPIFEILAAVTDSRRGPCAAVWPAIWGFKRWFVPGLILGILAAIVCLRFLASPDLLTAVLSGPPAVARLLTGDVAQLLPFSKAIVAVVAAALAVVIAVLTLFGFPVAALVIGTVLRTLTVLPANYYGICTGFHNQDDPPPAFFGEDKPLQPLTEWLMLLLDRLAGVDASDAQPLTFGDLWGLDRQQRANPEWQDRASELRKNVEERDVNLELVTTCISKGRPYKFPLDLRTFYFDKETMEHFFPPRVVQWMSEHQRAPIGDPDDADARARDAGYLRLPNPEDLPVIVAARMSLSVPPLISAVPLYAFDFSLAKDKILPPAEKCWFSDGGITSNFPMHFFDSPLPRWPTFGINLRPAPPNHPIVDDDQCENVYMPRTNQEAVNLPWPARWTDFGGFVSAIVRTMQNWNDDIQLTQPGFRDRIAHVSLADHEGGFNLSMPSETVHDLGERGRCAGEKLVDAFTAPADAPDIELTWANHRWTRYRATMANLAEYLDAFQRGYFDRERDRRGGAASYPDLIDRALGDPPRSYRWTDDLREFAKGETLKVAETGQNWTIARKSFDDDEPPRPRGEVRSIPRL